MSFSLHAKCVAGVLLLAFLGCGSEKGPEPKPTSDLRLEPLPHEEAEFMALWLSGEIEAPLDLYERIRNDLLTIRTDYQHIPELDSVAFVPPWGVGQLGFEYSEGGLDHVLAGENPVWDSLNDLYQPVFDQAFANANFPGRLHPERLSEAYGAVEEVASVRLAIPFHDGGFSNHINPVVQSTTDLGYAFQRAYRTPPFGMPYHWSFWCFYSTPSGISYAGQYSFDSAEAGQGQPPWWVDFCPSVRLANGLPFEWCLSVEAGTKVQITNVGRELLREDGYCQSDIQIDQDTLQVTVSASGGCHEHYLSLYMTPASFLESSPVQADLIVAHDGNGDACRSIVHPSEKFDLAPIAELYEHLYGGRDDIILRIWDYDQTGFDTVTYSPE